MLSCKYQLIDSYLVLKENKKLALDPFLTIISGLKLQGIVWQSEDTTTIKEI